MTDLAGKKILYVITKSNWGGALWKPSVFQRSLLTQVAAFLHGELPFPDPLPRAAKSFQNLCKAI